LLNPDLTWTCHLPDEPHISCTGGEANHEFGYADGKPGRPDPAQYTLSGTKSTTKLLNPELTWTSHLPDEPHITQAGGEDNHEFGYASGKSGRPDQTQSTLLGTSSTHKLLNPDFTSTGQLPD
jgi:hypothetical protein